MPSATDTINWPHLILTNNGLSCHPLYTVAFNPVSNISQVMLDFSSYQRTDTVDIPFHKYQRFSVRLWRFMVFIDCACLNQVTNLKLYLKTESTLLSAGTITEDDPLFHTKFAHQKQNKHVFMGTITVNISFQESLLNEIDITAEKEHRNCSGSAMP